MESCEPCKELKNLFKKNDKILIGSIYNYLKLNVILGDTISHESLNILTSLLRSLTYCLVHYNKNNNSSKSYLEKIKILEGKVDVFVKNCPNLCSYKEKIK